MLDAFGRTTSSIPSPQGHPRNSPRATRLIERIAATVGDTGTSEQLLEFAWPLLERARIVESEPLADPSAFARRLATLLERGLPAA